MGGKKGSGSLFCAPNRQFFSDWSHFRIFIETISPARISVATNPWISLFIDTTDLSPSPVPSSQTIHINGSVSVCNI
jgi:hypothetical protein